MFQQLPSSDGDWLRTADACLRALRLHESEAAEITDWWRSDGTWRLYARFEWCLVRTELLDARLCGSLALGVSESNALLGEVDIIPFLNMVRVAESSATGWSRYMHARLEVGPGAYPVWTPLVWLDHDPAWERVRTPSDVVRMSGPTRPDGDARGE